MFVLINLGCAMKTTSGKCCMFPFTYKGVRYNKCTTKKHNRPWCSLTDPYRGKWGNCAGSFLTTIYGNSLFPDHSFLSSYLLPFIPSFHLPFCLPSFSTSFLPFFPTFFPSFLPSFLTSQFPPFLSSFSLPSFLPSTIQG